MNTTFNSGAVTKLIERLTESGMLIEQVGEDAFNVISNATGAVLERLTPATELAKYVRCMDYVAEKHGREIEEGFSYIKPVHN